MAEVCKNSLDGLGSAPDRESFDWQNATLGETMSHIQAISAQSLSGMQSAGFFSADQFLPSFDTKGAKAQEKLEAYYQSYKLKNAAFEISISREISEMESRLRDNNLELDQETVEYLLKGSESVAEAAMSRAKHNAKELKKIRAARRIAVKHSKRAAQYLSDLSSRIERMFDKETNFFLDTSSYIRGIARAFDPDNKPTAGPFDSADELIEHLNSL